MVAEKKSPVTEFKLGTYALIRSFRHMSLSWPQPFIAITLMYQYMYMDGPSGVCTEDVRGYSFLHGIP